jgi:hypothetical protein
MTSLRHHRESHNRAPLTRRDLLGVAVGGRCRAAGRRGDDRIDGWLPMAVAIRGRDPEICLTELQMICSTSVRGASCQGQPLRSWLNCFAYLWARRCTSCLADV